MAVQNQRGRALIAKVLRTRLTAPIKFDLASSMPSEMICRELRSVKSSPNFDIKQRGIF